MLRMDSFWCYLHQSLLSEFRSNENDWSFHLRRRSAETSKRSSSSCSCSCSCASSCASSGASSGSSSGGKLLLETGLPLEVPVASVAITAHPAGEELVSTRAPAPARRSCSYPCIRLAALKESSARIAVLGRHGGTCVQTQSRIQQLPMSIIQIQSNFYHQYQTRIEPIIRSCCLKVIRGSVEIHPAVSQGKQSSNWLG